MRIDKIYLVLTVIIIGASASWITSCTHKADISDIPAICFDSEILPIFLNNCALASCHDGKGESDLILKSYQDIIEEVEPGDPGDSKIYKVITMTSGEDRMPPDQPLSTDNRTLIRIWIEQGARQDQCPE